VQQRFQPVEGSARYAVLDLARGFALFGVLIVNLLYFFRVSLFGHMLNEHSHAGWANHAVDDFVSQWIEFKAFDLFSLTFGIGVAVQVERARARGLNAAPFLARRFAILLVFGLAHMTLIANVDILSLYAVCGLLLIPLERLPARVLALVGVAAIFAPSLLPGPAFPNGESLREHAAQATRIYSHGGFAAMVAFRWDETRHLILPILIAVAQKTLGLMMLGVAVWRSGAIQNPAPYRRLLWIMCALAAVAGVVLREDVPLAIAYGTALLAWRRSERAKRWTAPVAAAGRMAFTNYLTESLVFAVVFYGFGLIGRLSPLAAAGLGVAFYAGQLCLSAWWLERHRFGPFEWAWRSLTYGRRQAWGR
jgi:uncharacterized protein